ncbi:hypothetical protein V2J09_012839 [Rumex salicifolius]
MRNRSSMDSRVLVDTFAFLILLDFFPGPCKPKMTVGELKVMLDNLEYMCFAIIRHIFNASPTIISYYDATS